MNKTIAEASLDNLHDIIVPEAIGYFPLAPGWYILGLLVLALLFHFSMHLYKQYQKSLYKREALAELAHHNAEGKDEVIHLLTLAKRVAISAYGREKIAKLSGESWWDFMEEHSQAKVSKALRVEIDNILYDKTYESNASDETSIRAFVTRWIKTHKVTKDV